MLLNRTGEPGRGVGIVRNLAHRLPVERSANSLDGRRRAGCLESSLGAPVAFAALARRSELGHHYSILRHLRAQDEAQSGTLPCRFDEMLPCAQGWRL